MNRILTIIYFFVGLTERIILSVPFTTRSTKRQRVPRKSSLVLKSQILNLAKMLFIWSSHVQQEEHGMEKRASIQSYHKPPTLSACFLQSKMTPYTTIQQPAAVHPTPSQASRICSSCIAQRLLLFQQHSSSTPSAFHGAI